MFVYVTWAVTMAKMPATSLPVIMENKCSPLDG